MVKHFYIGIFASESHHSHDLVKTLAQCPGVQILLKQAVETPMVIHRLFCVLIPNSLTVTDGCHGQWVLAVALFMSSRKKKKNYFPQAEI